MDISIIIAWTAGLSLSLVEIISRVLVVTEAAAALKVDNGAKVGPVVEAEAGMAAKEVIELKPAEEDIDSSDEVCRQWIF